MALNKITKAETDGMFHEGQPDTPNKTTLEMQKFLDAVPKLIIENINGNVDYLNALELSKSVISEDITDIRISGAAFEYSQDNGQSWSALTPGGGGGGGGDMYKSVYDKNNDGVVDNAAALDSQNAAYYLNTDNHTDGTLNKIFSAAEKTKLSGIDDNANDYTHPATHSADILVDGATNKVFTDTLKTSYDGAVTNSHSHTNKSTLDSIEQSLTTALKTSYDGAVTNSHTHANKTTLDSVQEALTTALKTNYDTAYTNNHTHANKTALDSVSGVNTGDQDLGDFVDKTSAQTIDGVKTFTSFPVTPQSAPTTDYQTANKKYADDNAGIKSLYEDTAPKLKAELDCNLNTISGAEYDNQSSGTSKTIDWKKGNHQKVTMSNNCSFTFTAPARPCMLSLRFIQDASGNRNITLPTIKWPGGTAPVWSKGAGAIDILSLYYDGSGYYGQGSLNFV